MLITKHGVARFKERQKIKNNEEMVHKTMCAIEHGKLLKNYSYSLETTCYLFDGYCYVVAGKNERLVTVFRPYRQNLKSKKAKLYDIREKEYMDEIRILTF